MVGSTVTVGLKIDMLRENPEISFEIDHITDMVNRECVIIRDVCEELIELREKQQAMQKLIDQITLFLRELTRIYRMVKRPGMTTSEMTSNSFFVKSISAREQGGFKKNSQLKNLANIYLLFLPC